MVRGSLGGSFLGKVFVFWTRGLGLRFSVVRFNVETPRVWDLG